MKHEGDLSRKAEEFMGIFKKGMEFTQEPLKENERLRYKIVKREEGLKNLQKLASTPEVLKLRQTIAESEETAVVYGMPKEVIEDGIVDKVLPLSQITREIIRSV